jgi:hypothetical protein
MSAILHQADLHLQAIMPQIINNLRRYCYGYTCDLYFPQVADSDEGASIYLDHDQDYQFVYDETAGPDIEDRDVLFTTVLGERFEYNEVVDTFDLEITAYVTASIPQNTLIEAKLINGDISRWRVKDRKEFVVLSGTSVLSRLVLVPYA